MPAQESNESGGEAKKSKKGCLIGCVVVLGIVVVLIIGFVLAITQVDSLRSKMLDYMIAGVKKSIVAKLPEDYDREKFEQAYEDFLAGIKNGDVDKGEISDMANEVTEALADGELTKEELDELIEKAYESRKN